MAAARARVYAISGCPTKRAWEQDCYFSYTLPFFPLQTLVSDVFVKIKVPDTVRIVRTIEIIFEPTCKQAVAFINMTTRVKK